MLFRFEPDSLMHNNTKEIPVRIFIAIFRNQYVINVNVEIVISRNYSVIVTIFPRNSEANIEAFSCWN